MTYVMAIDNGTQSVRAIVFDEHGEVVASGKQEIEPYFSAQPGWAEQNVDVYWQAMLTACHQVWQSGAVEPSQIEGLSVTTQRGTVVCMDDKGRALRPAIIWLDQREAAGTPQLPARWRLLFKLAGVSHTIERFCKRAQLNWLAEHEPEAWKRTQRFGLLSAWLNCQLTGEFRDSIASQVGYIPFDFKRRSWAGKRDWRWHVLPVRPDQLPVLVEPGERLGLLQAKQAGEMGLPEGLPVFAAASDKACEILGSGGYTPEIGCLSYGTTATINTCRDSYLEVEPHMPPYPAAVPGRFATEVNIYRGFWMVSWFKKEFGSREVALADQLDVAPETVLDKLISDIPAGSMGLVLQPYWSPGARDPGPEAKGGIIGFGDVHTRAHIYRAILEGLAYGLREGLEKIEKRSGTKLQYLRVSGGGSKSDIALQLTADIFNLPVERPHTAETSALGAAINTMVGLGIYPNHRSAMERMTRVGRRFEPQQHAVATYERLYVEVYKRMYKQLQPLYKSIRDITGYPSL